MSACWTMCLWPGRRAVVQDEELLMLMQMLASMSVLEEEDELQEVVLEVGCLVVVEGQVVQMLSWMKKLLSQILLLKMLWAKELQVEQHRW